MAWRVDQLRDSAVELMNRCQAQQRQVEPQLTLVNQRWGELGTRLKVRGSKGEPGDMLQDME